MKQNHHTPRKTRQASRSRRNASTTTAGRQQMLLKAGLQELLLLAFCFASLYLLVSLFTYYPLDPGWQDDLEQVHEVRNKGGVAGAIFADLFFRLFGYFAYLFALMVGYLGWLIYKGKHQDLLREPKHLILPGIGFVLTLSAGCGLAIVHFAKESALLPSHAGGMLGSWVGHGLESMISPLGATLLLLVVFFSGLTMLTGWSWFRIMDRLGGYTLKTLPRIQYFIAHTIWPEILRNSIRFWAGLQQLLSKISSYLGPMVQERWESIQARLEERRLRREEAYADYLAAQERADLEYEAEIEEAEQHLRAEAMEAKAKQSMPLEKEEVAQKKSTKAAATQVLEDQALQESLAAEACAEVLPNETPGAEEALESAMQYDEAEEEDEFDEVADDELRHRVEMAIVMINRRLQAQAELKQIQRGPVVTRAEILPDPQPMKFSEISDLAEHLVEQLKLPGVRVLEGKQGLIHLEIPNQQRDEILLNSLLLSKAYQESRSPLTIALGKDSSGHSVIIDLARMPHLLIGGHEGEDIDQCLHNILLSLINKASPEALRLILMDSRHNGLSAYEHLPHLLSPLLHKSSHRIQKVLQLLEWCNAEMERRYQLMHDIGVRTIDGYNQKVESSRIQDTPEGIPVQLTPIPYILVLVHELEDITLQVEEVQQVENLITRLVQKSRSAGIHMVLATRNPSVNVVTGLMKNNFPTRIALQVNDKSESRNLLGQEGAEKLLGAGDMYYLTPGTGTPARIHAASITPEERHSLIADIQKHHAHPKYDTLIAT